MSVWGPRKNAPHKHFLVSDDEGSRWLCMLCGEVFSKEEIPQNSVFFAAEI